MSREAKSLEKPINSSYFDLLQLHHQRESSKLGCLSRLSHRCMFPNEKRGKWRMRARNKITCKEYGGPPPVVFARERDRERERGA